MTVRAAIAADSFVDSIGVNIHANDSAVANYPSSWLTYPAWLGVRHVRDTYGLSSTGQKARLQSLVTSGIGYTFALAGSTVSSATMTGTVFPAFLAAGFPTPDAIEGWNEHDGAGGSYASDITGFQSSLYSSIKSAYPTAQVLGASLVDNTHQSTVGSLGSNIDANNVHLYGRPAQEPEFNASFGNAQLSNLTTQGSGKPLWITEFGYSNGTYVAYEDTTELAAARLIPRTLLYCFCPSTMPTVTSSPFSSGSGGLGAARTFVYDLIDDHATATTYQDRYGLFHNDGTPKQAARSLKNLIQILKEPGASFTPGSIDITSSLAASASMSYLIFQKSNGNFFIAYWMGKRVIDPNSTTYQSGGATDRTDPGQAFTFTTANNFTSRVYRPSLGTAAQSSTTSPSTTFSLNAAYDVQILELIPTAASASPAGTIGSFLIGTGTVGSRSDVILPGVGTSNISIQVQFAYGAAPDEPSPAWTDETRRVRLESGFSLTRGVTTERGNLQAGTLDLTLDNRDRRFDPTHTLGPLYGLLRPRTPVRVNLGVSGVYETVWRGVVEGGWPQNYMPTDNDSTVNISAVDAFGYLAQQDNLPATWFDVVVTDDEPVNWLRFDDPGPDVVDVITGDTADAQGAPAKIDSVLKGRLGAALFQRGESYQSSSIFAPSLYSSVGSVEVLFSATKPTSLIVEPSSDPTASTFTLNVGTSMPYGDYISVSSVNGIHTGLLPTENTIHLLDGNPHQIVVTSDGATWSIYVDGLRAETATPGVTVTGSLTQSHAVFGNTGSTGVTTLTDVIYYDTTLTAAQVAAHWTAAHSQRELEHVNDRLGFVLDAADWGLHDISGFGQVVGTAYKGDNAMTLVQQLQDTEQGRIYVDSNGVVSFANRSWAWGTTSTASLTDDGTGLPYSAGGTTFVLDDRVMVNDVTVTRDGGTAQNKKDQTSIDTNGRRTASVSGLWPTDFQARGVAEWIILSQKDPVPRVDQVMIQPARAPDSLWAFIRDLDLGQLISVTRHVKNNGVAVGSPATVSAHVIGITHTYSGGDSWRTTLQLDGTRAGWSFFQLDVSHLDNSPGLAF